MTQKSQPRLQQIFGALVLTACIATLAPGLSRAQLPLPSAAPPATNPFADPSAKPGKLFLLDLEARFAKDVAERGGPAFAEWFAEDGVSLSNGEAPITGRAAIAKATTWSPKNYQLAWTPTDAVMGPSGDMGYTWGHYEARSFDAGGHVTTATGRYLTIWRRQPDESWKVTLDAGANEPVGAGDCCRITPGK